MKDAEQLQAPDLCEQPLQDRTQSIIHIHAMRHHYSE
jgi:hypothetical protein